MTDTFTESGTPSSHETTNAVNTSNNNSDSTTVDKNVSSSPAIPSLTKKTKKVLIGLFLLIPLTIFALFVFQEKPQIEKEIDVKLFQEQLDKLCPMPFGDDGILTFITYSRNKSIFKSYPSLTYTIEYPSEKSLDNFLRLEEEEKKERFAIALLLLNEQQQNEEKILSDIFKYDLDVIYDIIYPKGKKHIHISSKEIKDLYNNFLDNPQNVMFKFLQAEIDRTRRSLPQRIDEAMTITDVTLEGVNVVTHIVVDEDSLDMDLLQDYKSFVKESLSDDIISDPATMVDFSIYKISHTGLIYRYIGNLSNKKVDIRFSAEELSELVQTSKQIHKK